MSEIRVGVIGAGYWGPHLIRNVSELPEAYLTAVVDLSTDRLQALRRRYPSTLLTTSHEEALASGIDAVVIATPVKTHFRLAKLALEAGKHVLIEKPMTRTSAEALELIRTARERGLVLMSGHTFEYNPAVVALKEIVASGQIGRVLYADSARLNLGQFRTDVNVVWDLAPHDISILNYIFDSAPSHVSAYGSTCIAPDRADVAYIHATYPDNVVGHLHISWLEPCKVRRVTIVGDEKMVVYNDVSAEEKIRIYHKGVIKTTSTGDFADFQLTYHYGGMSVPAIASGEPLKLELTHFLECITTGCHPRSDGWSGYRVVAALEAAERSLQNGGLPTRISMECRPDHTRVLAPVGN